VLDSRTLLPTDSNEIEPETRQGCGCVRPSAPVHHPAPETALADRAMEGDPEDACQRTDGGELDQADDVAAEPAPDQQSTLAGAEPAQGAARTGVKLVIRLHPDASAGYRALLALGADGCDPELRAAAVPDLLAALDEVPSLLADAEARWHTRPRYPTLPRPTTRHGPGTAGRAQPNTRAPAVPAPLPPGATPRATPVPDAPVSPQQPVARPTAPVPPGAVPPRSANSPAPDSQLTLFG
jgi:hypothetical protein